MRTPQQIANAEICCCLSGLVATLAAGVYLEDRMALKHDHGAREAIHDLFASAAELAAPIDDWEETAIQAGAVHSGSMWSHDDHPLAETSASALCYALGLDPYQREVFEHWAVTDWLADQLIERGEKVDKDFAGLCVWARTTTGQAIYADSVFEAIAADLNRGEP